MALAPLRQAALEQAVIDSAGHQAERHPCRCICEWQSGAVEHQESARGETRTQGLDLLVPVLVIEEQLSAEDRNQSNENGISAGAVGGIYKLAWTRRTISE